MKAANKWHHKGTIETMGDVCNREAKDEEVGASLLLSQKPISSEEACKDNNLMVKELAIKEHGKVGASLLLSKKPVSSQENTCMKDCLE
eukprot:2645462-Ditylum_brightwellii.AAC.1